MSKDDLLLGLKEIFRYKGMLENVVFASMNTPADYMDNIFPIYEEIVELVESFEPFTLLEFKQFVSDDLVKYDAQPFFPVLAGLYVNALINKLFEYSDYQVIDLNELCYKIIDNASQEATSHDESSGKNEVGFSLDFMGYLLHPKKNLTIIGPVGDYCGALMGENSRLVLKGMHGKNLGYEKANSAKIIEK